MILKRTAEDLLGLKQVDGFTCLEQIQDLAQEIVALKERGAILHSLCINLMEIGKLQQEQLDILFRRMESGKT